MCVTGLMRTADISHLGAQDNYSRILRLIMPDACEWQDTIKLKYLTMSRVFYLNDHFLFTFCKYTLFALYANATLGVFMMNILYIMQFSFHTLSFSKVVRMSCRLHPRVVVHNIKKMALLET